jgi:hypothetical protein
VAVAGGDLTLTGVTVAGETAGMAVQADALTWSALTVVDVVVDGALGTGLMIDGVHASVEAERLTVRGTREHGIDFGRGIELRRGASLSAAELRLEDNRDVGLLASEPYTTVVLTGGEVRGTRAVLDEGSGWGIGIQEGASLVAADLVIVDNEEVGLYAASEGTRVDLERVVVRGTVVDSLGNGKGISMQDGAHLSARELLVEGNEGGGLFVGGAGALAELDDTRIVGTRPGGELDQGQGLSAVSGGRVVATGLILEENHGIGLFAANGLSSVVVHGGRITDTQPSTITGGGLGVIVQGQEAAVELQDVVISGSTGPGAYVDSGRFDCRGCSLTGNEFAAVVVIGGVVNLDGGNISSTGASGERGGGVGVFCWNHPEVEDDPALEVRGTRFADLPGPAVYLRGVGRYDVRHAEVHACASADGPFGSPPAVVVVEGIGQAGPSDGLFLSGNLFSDLPGDAILLDASSATLLSNLFQGIGGYDVYTQHCEGVPAPEIVPPDATINDCQGFPRVLEPLLTWVPMLLPIEAER